MRNELRDAYLLVLEDLMENGSSILQGRYDAEHGNRIYMYGVQYVMETVAHKADEKLGDLFTELFMRNVLLSEERSRQ